MPTRALSWAAVGIASLAAAGGALAAEPQPWEMNFQPAATPVMRDIENFHTALLWVISLISLFVLGLLDSAAMTPLASLTLGVSRVHGWLHVGLIVVAAAGVLSAAVVVALPRLARLGAVARFRLASFVGDNAAPRGEAFWAWAGILCSWLLRALAVFLLLAALGLGTDFSLALAFVCASSASAVLPVAPAGAAVQAGAGAAILVASGVHTEDAVAFGIAAQGLLMATGAAFVLAMGAWHAQGALSRSPRSSF